MRPGLQSMRVWLNGLLVSILLGGYGCMNPWQRRYPEMPGPPRPGIEVATNAAPVAAGEVYDPARYHRLDRFHDWFFVLCNTSVDEIDELFMAGDMPIPHETNSTFRMKIYLDTRDENDELQFKVKPKFGADLYLPECERCANVFVGNVDEDALPGQDPLEDPAKVYVGLRRALDFVDVLNMDVSAGIQFGWPIAYFAKSRLGYDFNGTNWSVKPQIQFTWYSDDRGPGGKASLSGYKTLDSLWRLKSSTAARTSETTEGVEWDQVLGFDRCLSGTCREPRVSLGTQGVVYGHADDENVVDGTRWDVLIWRFPIRKRWLFMEITPRINWKNENDWEPEGSILIGFDGLFRDATQRFEE